MNDLASRSLIARVAVFDVPETLERMFRCPVIIVGAPRSGTTMLFETLAQCANVWTIGGESLDIIDRRGELDDRGNRLDASDADPETSHLVRAGFLSVARDRDKNLYIEHGPEERPTFVRFLEKTPRNSLRIPFLRSIFPDAKFIYLYRDPRSNIGSLIDGWQHAKGRWTFVAPPGWRGLKGKPISEIAAAQWCAANQFILSDLVRLPRNDWTFVEYEQLIADPEAQVRKLCQFASLEIDEVLEALLRRPLPLSQTTLTPPNPEKWRRHQKQIDAVLLSLRPITARIAELKKTASMSHS